ncbi:MAG TPA: glycosyltransferase [Candidatus Nitrosotalea sp.]|nr:glycosyltransferase [Candidatus Nitrosotalea sp.]
MSPLALSCDLSGLDLEHPLGQAGFAQYLLQGLGGGVSLGPPARGRPTLILDGRPRLAWGSASVSAVCDLSHVFAAAAMGRSEWLGRNLRTALLARLSTDLVVPSDEVARGLELYLRVPPRRILVMVPRPGPEYRRVSRVQVAQVRSEYGLDRPYLVFVGAASRRKNLALLGRAWRAAAAQIEGGLELVMVGPEPAGIEGARDMGWLPSSRLAALLSGAVAYVNPSLWEGSAIGADEAMACAAPTLVAARGALPRAVEGAGLALDPSVLEDWVSAIVAVASRPQLRGELGAGALRRAAALRAQVQDWSGLRGRLYDLSGGEG